MDTMLTLSFDRSPLAGDPVFSRRLVTVPAMRPPDLPDPIRQVAQRAWLDRARSEYVGVMIARRFWGLSVDMNAPSDIQELCLKMVLDEQRHAHLCIVAAESLGAQSDVTFDLDELQQVRSTESVSDQFLKMAIQTYAVGEVTALGLIRFALSDLPDSGYRDVLKIIAADEVLHGRIGPRLLAAVKGGLTAHWLQWPGDDVVRALRDEYRQAMSHRDVVESDEALLFQDALSAQQLRSVGIPDSRGFKTAYHRALNQDVDAGFAFMDGEG